MLRRRRQFDRHTGTGGAFAFECHQETEQEKQIVEDCVFPWCTDAHAEEIASVRMTCGE